MSFAKLLIYLFNFFANFGLSVSRNQNIPSVKENFEQYLFEEAASVQQFQFSSTFTRKFGQSFVHCQFSIFTWILCKFVINVFNLYLFVCFIGVLRHVFQGRIQQQIISSGSSLSNPIRNLSPCIFKRLSFFAIGATGGGRYITTILSRLDVRQTLLWRTILVTFRLSDLALSTSSQAVLLAQLCSPKVRLGLVNPVCILQAQTKLIRVAKSSSYRLVNCCKPRQMFRLQVDCQNHILTLT